MKLRISIFVFSLIFVFSNVFATGCPLGVDNRSKNIELEGLFGAIGAKSLPVIPIVAFISADNQLDVTFVRPFGNVTVRVVTEGEVVYVTTVDSNQQTFLSVSVDNDEERI